jgi:HEAT repeat protein
MTTRILFGSIGLLALVLALVGASPGVRGEDESEKQAATVRRLLKELESKDVKVQQSTIEELIRTVDGRNLPELMRAARDERPHVRAAAWRVFYKLAGNPKAREKLPPLLIKGFRDKSVLVRRSAAFVAGLYGDPDNGLVPPLIKALDDKDWEVRFCAVGSLGRIRGDALKTTIPVLIKRLKTADEQMRYWIVVQLGWSGSWHDTMVPVILPALRKILKDRKEVPKALKAYASGGSLRAVAAGAIGTIGPAAKDAVPDLRAVLKEKPWGKKGTATTLRGTVVSALGRIGPNALAALPDLVATAGNVREDSSCRGAAITALGNMGLPAARAALPTLEKLDKEETDAHVRQVVSQVLPKLQKLRKKAP